MTIGARRILLLMICGIMSAYATLPAQNLVPSENGAKAKFLYSFTKFVTWPDDAFSDTTSPLVMGVLGDDALADVLQKTVEGKLVTGRSVIVRRWANPDSLSACHVLFVGRNAAEGFAEHLPLLVRHHTLTVGDREHFVDLGGVIGLVINNNKVQFEINQSAAEKAELRISSLLLTVATGTTKE